MRVRDPGVCSIVRPDRRRHPLLIEIDRGPTPAPGEEREMSNSTATFTAHVVRTGPRPCYKHTAHRWMASCDDCTAWHLGRQIAARTATAPVLALVPPAGRRPAAALRAAA
jgi:hypothetical protein